MPIVNASMYWSRLVPTSAYATMYAATVVEALRQIALGLNTFTVSAYSMGVDRPYTSYADLSNMDDYPYGSVWLRSMIDVQTDATVLAAYNAKHGTSIIRLPVTLQISFGAFGTADWDYTEYPVESSARGAATLFRSTDLGHGSVAASPEEYDSAYADYIDTYHTCVQDEMTSHGMTLRELIEHVQSTNDPATTLAVDPGRIRCPCYRGTYYDNALAKFEQYIKWIEPVHVALDVEPWLDGYYGASCLNQFIGVGTGADDALASCSRCESIAGYEAGKDALAKALIDKVHEYVTNAVVTFYNCYTAKANFDTEIYGGGFFFNYGDYSDSTIATGAPVLYWLSYMDDVPTGHPGVDPADQLYIERVTPTLYDPHYDDAPQNETGNYYGMWWGVQPTALLGSYVWLTHCAGSTMHTTDNTDYGGYLTNDQFYNLCYALGRDGATGFYLYPGYSTTAECANNLALDRLIPVGIAAFADAAVFNAAAALPKVSGKPLRFRSNA